MKTLGRRPSRTSYRRKEHTAVDRVDGQPGVVSVVEDDRTVRRHPPTLRVVTVGVAVVALIGAVVLAVRKSPGSNQPVDSLTHFLLAVAVVVLACHLLGGLMVRFRQPAVVGEVLGGILLGPSLFGQLWPVGRDWLFPRPVLTALDAAAQLGLAMFMFLLGSELRMARAPGRRSTIALVVSGSVGVPFLAGAAFALVAGDALAGSASRSAHVLFLGLAVSITALPVLARILTDLRLSYAPEGTLALAAAAVGDGIAWLVLTAILLVIGVGSLAQAGVRALATVALLLVTFLGIRPLLARLIGRFDGREGVILPPVLTSAALAYAAATQLLGLHPVVGAFLFGTIMPADSAVVARLRERLRGFTLTILLPLFFAGVGLNTSVGLLGGSLSHWLLMGLLLVAAATKFAGAAAGARTAGLGRRAALRLGGLMNCRGVTEIVVASIGYQYGLINRLGLTMLVLMAVATTAMTGPLVRALSPPSPESSAAEPQDCR
jgi:Kef-type K+ transport system membrane component KefB